MLSTAIVIADGLGGGFARAARAADLPDVIVRFDPEARERVESRIRALPDIAAFSTRQEFTERRHRSERPQQRPGLGRGDRRRPPRLRDRCRSRSIRALRRGRDRARRRAGVGHPARRDLLRPRARAVARGRFRRGSRQRRLPARRSRGSTSPRRRSMPGSDPIRTRRSTSRRSGCATPPYLNEVLVQARTTSYGLRGLRVITRSGVRVLLDQAAGIVIDLLVALSLFALATAAVMLAASARAEVQRRLQAIGISRAVGASRGHIVRVQAVEAATVALPAATVGLLVGVLATAGPSDRLLTMLNEPPARLWADPPTRRRLGARASRSPCSRPPGRPGGRPDDRRSRCSRAPGSRPAGRGSAAPDPRRCLAPAWRCSAPASSPLAGAASPRPC